MNANIINTTTGQTGYQVPGASLPPGYTNAPVNTTVNASDIAKGATPLTIPTPPPSGNPATPIIAGAQASQDAAEKQAEKDTQVANDASGLTGTQNQQSSMMDSIKSILGMESSAQTASANRPEVDQANTELTNINTQIADTNVKYRAAVDEAASAPSLAGQQSLKGVADANYGRQLADLAIRQSAASSNVEALTKAADDKLALTLAPLQTELSYYKDFLSANLDSLSKSEQTQVQNIISDKQNILTQTQSQETAKTDLLKTALTNGVKLTDAQTQAVLTAPDAASAAAALSAMGVNLQANSYSAVTNPITGAQTSFNTKTGQFGASTGGAIPTPQGGAASTDFNEAGVPLTAAAANSLGGIYSAAWDTVNGLKAPGQTSFRGAAAMTALTSAQDRISQALFGHNYDAAAAQNAFNFRNSDTYQKYTANAPIAISTINQIASLVQNLGLTSFSPANTALITFKAATGNQDAKTLQSLLAVSQDDIGLLLGAGSGSDFKTKLGSVIFSADGSVNQTQALASAIQDRITSKLSDYYAKAGVTDSSTYAKQDATTLSGGTSSGTAAPANTTLMTGPDGKQYNVPNDQVDAFTKAGGHK